MRVHVQTRLGCSAAQAWNAVRTSALLHNVAWPVVSIRPARGEKLPDLWPPQETIRCRSYLFGVIPLGTRSIHFERVDSIEREIQSRETDPLIRHWDHLIRVRESEPDVCVYSDDVTIEAGWLTPVVWLFACFFYRHRQRRWRRLAPHLR